ncbi:conserved hypothetical protein [Prevotella intermedia]|uniref:Uncharacterized protein n=1 Tax=Prevotella intermedia TaxID=28131 RepID=A0A0S3UHM4_PREIN|nr:conserved hypothetical protein [Prevotella intermedia]
MGMQRRQIRTQAHKRKPLYDFGLVTLLLTRGNLNK